MKNAFHLFSLGDQNYIGQVLAGGNHAVTARICFKLELSMEGKGTTRSEITIEELLARIRLKARNV